MEPLAKPLNVYAQCLVEFANDVDGAIEAQEEAIRLSRKELESLMKDKEENKWRIEWMKKQIANFEAYLDELNRKAR